MAGPLHVVHVVLSLEPGGLENGVVNVVNGLDPTRFRSTVCCLRRRGAFAARITAPGATVIEAGVPAGNSLRGLLRLARILRRSQPCLVHTRNAEAFLYGALAARLAGVEVLVHSEHGRTFDDAPRRLLAQRWLSRFAQRIFAVSAQLREDLARYVGIPAARIDVLHNGVDLERFRGGDAAAARARLGVAAGALVVGSVGRLARVKDYDLLLRAVAALGDPRVHAVLVGDGPERAALQARADALGLADRVHFTGHRDDVAALLPGFDLFVLPSLSEGQSNTLLEAMAAGLPVVVSDAGGNPEIVRDGQDGRVFPAGDLPGCVQAIATLLADGALRARLAQAGAGRAREQFGLPAMIARYQQYYAQAWAARQGA